MTKAITNHEDVIDSRDVIARINELDAIEERSEEEREELDALTALQNEAEGSADWQFGETLIRDSYFKEYAQELAEDCGMLDKDAKWPMNCIDWDQAVKELQYDYSQVDFDGVPYWIRS